MIITLPFPASKLNPNSHIHWRRKNDSRAKAKRDAYILTKTQTNIPNYQSRNIKLMIIFYPPNNSHRDLDNLLSAMKPSIDGLALALGINDKQFRPITINMGKADHKNPRVEIELI